METTALMHRGIDWVKASGVLDRARKVGDRAPDFSLPNARGTDVSLAGLLRSGHVVVTFYRGGWCPYCNLTLRAYQEVLGELHELGAQLVAISPQLPDETLTMAERNELEFEVLSDVGNRVARLFGVLHDIPENLHDVHFELPESNGDSSYELPLPATFVVGSDWTVRYAFVDADYRLRAEPSEVLDAVRRLEDTRSERGGAA